MSSGLERVRERAKAEKKERFTALLHHVDVDLLRAAFSWLKRDAAPGVDGLTWRQYEQNVEGNLVDLHARVHRGAYRAQPSPCVRLLVAFNSIHGKAVVQSDAAGVRSSWLVLLSMEDRERGQ